jgi:succinate dehydrogenase/fumarate reductase flavoprotein subunit
LITEGNRVVGAEIEREGIGIPVMATHGVILATGGFGGDRELTGQWIPMPGDHVSIFPEGNVGDGIRLAKQARGVMGPTNTDNGVWVPISVRRNAAGRIIAKYPHFGSDRAKPGSIIVNFKGHRFANEAAPYQAFVNIMHQQRIAKAWLIGDHHMLRLYGMGLALPAPLPYKALIRDGYLIKAQSITLLAEAIGVDPVELENTVCRFNRYAVEGKDPDFHRGANIYDNAQGDFDLPSPNLGPLNSPPFYAVAIYPGDVSTVYGLKTSRDAQVLDASGSIVPGLYATGLDQNSIMRGFYPGGGCSIGPAMTFGFRAALSISASYHSVSKKVLGDRESTELQRE